MTKTDVKITVKGKISIKVSQSLKPFLLNFLELLMNDRPKPKLSMHTAKDLCYLALINELYVKHLVSLSLIDGDCRILLTLSQAYAIWELSQDYEHFAYANPQLGNILMELHRILTN